MRIKEVTLINYLAHKDAQVIMLFFCSLHLSPGTAVLFFFFGNVGTKEAWGAGISKFSSELRREVIRVKHAVYLHLRVNRVQSMSGSGRHGKFLK